VDRVEAGDELEIDVTAGTVRNHTRDETYAFVSIADFALEMIEAGGLLEYIRQR